MYLLKLRHSSTFPSALRIFTFHYVSIKTFAKLSAELATARFTFHYVSIKTFVNGYCKVLEYLFTFHYVSIKTFLQSDKSFFELNLHSTMYLLKLILPVDLIVTCVFTFHYVSIKTAVLLYLH